MKIIRPTVFVPMCADIFHHGHMNILIKASKYGNVIVGLMTDKGAAKYKSKPMIKYKNRKLIFEYLDIVKLVLPLNGLEYTKIAKKYKFNYFIHGSDWKNNNQSDERKRLISAMKLWKGKVIDAPYTKKISSSIQKKRLK